MSDYKLFYMTCKNKVEANKIAYALVKKDLVACANIIPNIKSYFKWNNKKVNENVIAFRNAINEASKVVYRHEVSQ